MEGARFKPPVRPDAHFTAIPRTDTPSAAARDRVSGRQARYGRHLRPSGAPPGPVSRSARPSAVPVPPGEVPPIVYQVLRGPGAPLDADTRTDMEHRLGTDLGRVRVHTDARAAASASAVNADAYTVGRSVVFSAGQYAPRSQAGRRLLTHELMHTVQQEGSASGQCLSLGSPASQAESEARSSEARPSAAAGGARFHVTSAVQRKIKSNANTIDEVNEERFTSGIEERLTQIARRRGWDDDFRDQIMDRITEMIRAVEVYPAQGQFHGYNELIDIVAQQLVAETAPPPPLPGVRHPPLARAPIRRNTAQSPQASPADLRAIRRTSSDLRRSSPTGLPEEFRLGASRRAAHDNSALDPGWQGASFGQFSGWVRGYGDNVTQGRGGKAQPYYDLWREFIQSAGRTDQQAAADILAMLHGEPERLLTYSLAALRTMDHILAILAVAEQARATSAVLHFAAAVNYVTQTPGGTFTGAFAGNSAAFLGANKGGAAALRGETPNRLASQETRAQGALTSYQQQYGKGLTPQRHLHGLMTNLASYSRVRQGGPLAVPDQRAFVAVVGLIAFIAAVFAALAYQAGAL